MKCPKCGAKIREGHLYCEQCGEEIQIVPEFEPEIENSIHTTLSRVANEITTRTKEQRTEPDTKNGPSEYKTQKRLAFRNKRLVFYVMIFLALGIALFFANRGVQYFSPDAQCKKAQRAMEKEAYEEAAGYYERAVALSPTNVSYLNGLSRCYYAMERLEDAKEVCLETVLLEGSNMEAYERLIDIYERLGQFENINELMQNCKDNDIRNHYVDYMANPPEAEAKGGTYHEVMNIKLIGNSAGTIYYTLDGSEPDENSPVYTNPILLEAGPYVLKAFFVNQYGVRSETAQENYYIDVVLPEAPEVMPKSGTYGKPHLLEIEVPADYKVYYTTDGSEPNSNSALYEGELWMPVGHSQLKFVTVSPGGICSEITQRQYTLDLHALLSMEAASNQLMLTLKNEGFLLNLQGDVPSGKGRNLYTYRYTLTINGHNYYFYREYYEESEGNSNATGRDYVVNYMSGECYQAVRQEDKTFKLYRIEQTDSPLTGRKGE